MRKMIVLALCVVAASSPIGAAPPSATLEVAGLSQPVEILRDRWGINHIYAKSEADLFFAQGYAAARDRLFQFELWRRQATGTVAEILGPKELKRDIGTRLHMFRGDLKAELNWYHPHGEAIVTSYVRGVNAYIAEALKTPDALPVEFKLLGIKPAPWTPEVIISRHNALLSNLGNPVHPLRHEAGQIGGINLRKRAVAFSAVVAIESGPTCHRCSADCVWINRHDLRMNQGEPQPGDGQHRAEWGRQFHFSVSR